MAKGEHDDLADALSRMSSDDQDETSHEAYDALPTTSQPAAPMQRQSSSRPAGPRPSAASSILTPLSEATPTQRPAVPPTRVRSAAPVINRPVPPPATVTPPPVAPPPAVPTLLPPEPVAYAPKKTPVRKASALGGQEFKRLVVPICLTLGTLMLLTGISFFLLDSRTPLRALPTYLPMMISFFGLLLLGVAGFNMMLIHQAVRRG